VAGLDALFCTLRLILGSEGGVLATHELNRAEISWGSFQSSDKNFPRWD